MTKRTTTSNCKMSTQHSILLFLASFIALYLSASATLPLLGQGSRRPGNWPRPGQQRPSSHDYDNPYKPDYPGRPGSIQRPGYPGRPGSIQPGFPHRPDYPQQPSYPDSHVYPDRDCKYGRPCRDPVNDDYVQPGDETGLDLGGYEDGYGEEGQSSHGQLGCSCLLYVESAIVFRRVNNRQRFSCNRYGLERCSRFCDELDEGLRARSRQEACDVLGREVHTPWYRKDQVCGSRGLSLGTPLKRDLCCRRGRPSLDCVDDFDE